jgi:hypothetical protein
MGIFSCLLGSCLLGNRPSKWLSVREKLLILMRFFLLILACVQEQQRMHFCIFYEDMYSFVNLANLYLSEYYKLTEAQKKSYQNRLHAILKNLSKNRTYIIGGTWGESWKLPQLYAFYRRVILDLKQNPYPGNNGVGQNYVLPALSYLSSSDPDIRDKIHNELFGVQFVLPQIMHTEYPVIFKSDTRALNDPPPVVSKPFVKANQPSNKSSGILWYLNSVTGNLEPYPAKLAEQIPVA